MYKYDDLEFSVRRQLTERFNTTSSKLFCGYLGDPVYQDKGVYISVAGVCVLNDKQCQYTTNGSRGYICDICEVYKHNFN